MNQSEIFHFHTDAFHPIVLILDTFGIENVRAGSIQDSHLFIGEIVGDVTLYLHDLLQSLGEGQPIAWHLEEFALAGEAFPHHPIDFVGHPTPGHLAM